MPGFDALSPEAVLTAVETAFQCALQPLVTPFSSYVNRVYGLEAEDGTSYVAKFYRPERWSDVAIEEEHQFLQELHENDIPVVCPLADSDGESLAEVDIETSTGLHSHLFSLFPKRGGRLFDSEDDDSWRRIGALCGRLHSIGSKKKSSQRIVWTPELATSSHVKAILQEEILPRDLQNQFEDMTQEALETIKPLFQGVPLLRVHGDLHRGNILDRGEEGLLLIDFDDMAQGPAMQDLWLLLPGRRDETQRETALIAEGYEDFRPFPWEELSLMEPLRFMRMVHFIAWCARQRKDQDFSRHFPDWGSRGWWIREIEDLSDQKALFA